MLRSPMLKVLPPAKAVVLGCLAAAVVAWAPTAGAQGSCTIVWSDTLLDTTYSCIASPIRDRAFDLETFRAADGGDYLMMSRGNELQIFSLGGDPLHPGSVDTSAFRFGTAGDSDYDVMSFDVCDGCRYGVMDHKVAGTVVFDLGTGTPRFATFSRQGTLSAGSIVFKQGSQQYLITAGLQSGCAGSALYAVNGVNNLSLLQCLEAAGTAFKSVGGEAYGGVLYLGGGLFAEAHIFQATGTGLDLRLQYLSKPSGMIGFHRALAIDPNYRILASADIRNRTIRFWDVSSPTNPVLKPYTINPINAGYVSLRSANASAPLVLAAHGDGWLNSARTFLVDPVTGPEAMNHAFWTDLEEPHNAFQTCVLDQGNALAPDGSALYMGRYATAQVFDLSQCMGPVQAVAEVTVTPSPVFPGGAVTVRDVSTGSYDRWALWVENSSGTVVAGTKTPSAAIPHTLSFTVPVNVGANETFTARITIESSELPPLVSQDSAAIVINRTPQASFTVTPDAAIVGDTVTLSASAEGSPATYSWLISPPGSGPFARSGPSTQVSLSQAGEWSFELTANYQHEDPAGGSSYRDIVTQTFNVSSVAADFTISPSSPLNTQAITLDGSGSKGAIASYEWTVAGPTSYGGCPAAAVCTIPADSLEWGSYTITLRVTAASQEWDDRVRTVTVANGAIQPSFGWIPTSPSIGESTVFQIQGVQGDIDRATWTMGGVGCDGASATQVCTPSQFNNCKALAFKYASGGNKVVGLTVRINGVDYVDGRLASERTVTVANTGSCDGGGGPVCTYSLSDDGANFGPNGGDGAFTVFTGSTCRWTATENLGWLRITSGASGTGTGTVRYAVDANSGPARSGSILAGGRFYGVNQEAPDVPANFVMSNPRPAIGEAVTFSVDPILQVLSWDFGEKDCRGHNSFIDCRFLPQSSCSEIEWSFPTAGDKPVTMVLSDGRTQTKVPTVRPVGECCLADRSPLASFTVSTDEPYVGEEVVFTDTSAKALTAKALGFSWTPTIPTIGELTTFTLSAVTGEVASATWNFGGGGCGGASATVTCSPGLFNNCTGQTFKYATAGDKQVSVTVQLVGGGSQSAGPRTVTVANTGSCDGGGGGGCSYSLSPISADFPPAGGNGAFNVSTAAGCAWTASTSAAWIGLGTASGSGSGVVSYTVTGHSGTSDRSGTILVQGRTHTVRQQAPAPDLDSDPTWWRWTVSLELEGGALEEVATSSERVFRYAFAGPGTYRVSLEAGNCVGSSTETTTLMVLESPIEDFVVGAAVKVSGANDTRWETDLRFHNPCGEPLDVRIEFEPEGENNSQASLFFREFVLAPAQTRVFADITEAIPGLVGEELSGSVRIISGSDSGCKVLSVSRTYNSTPDGTLGLFVPALPVKRAENELLDLTGLARNSAYRSNLRLVNYGDADVWVPLRALDRFGEPISNPREALVPGHSTKQINDVAGWLGVSGDLAPFSVRAEVEGLQVQAYATVVDNQTGDSVLFMSSFSGDNRVWVSGVASNSGVNDSRWRTDLWLYNPTADWLAGELDFVVGTKPDEVYGFSWPELKTQRVRDYLDLVGDELNLEEKSGYLVLTGEDGGPAPQVAARTYNLALDGGTYGLGLRTFADGDLLKLGETAYIVGVSNSADQSLGFRTNLALLNTDENFWIGVRLTLIDLSGAAVGEPLDLMLAPGVLRQFDLAERFGVAELTGTASLEIEVTAGNGLAAYATEIDNRTQDAIFIPAQRKVMGAPN